jgi:hypothetical protein
LWVQANPGQKVSEAAISINKQVCWALVAHTCNPSSSEGRDQEDHGSKPALVNSSYLFAHSSYLRPYPEKNPSQKKAGEVAQGVGPEFKLQYSKKDKWGMAACDCDPSYVGGIGRRG